MTGDIVVDDHLLLRVVLDDEPRELRLRAGRIVTTGLWYHRLCRALVDPAITGALSRSLGSVEPTVAAAALHAVIDLPEDIGLASLRTLAWPMARLVAAGARLNLLALEALAAALELDAEICLAAADVNRPLIEAADAHGVPVRLIAA